MSGQGTNPEGKLTYEAPRLERLGLFHVETRFGGCYSTPLGGKQVGGYDGVHFMGINIAISSCSG